MGSLGEAMIGPFAAINDEVRVKLEWYEL